MSLRMISRAAAFALCCFLGSMGFAWAQEQPDLPPHSADISFETADIAMNGKIYVSAGKERREMVMEGMIMITIRRDDLGKTLVLMPDEQMYMEMPAGQNNGSDMVADNPADYQVEMTEVGPEELEGVETIKHKVIMTGADGSKMGGFWWISAEGIPVKMDMLAIDEGSKTRLKQQLTNLVLGEPDPSLFEIPEGYQNMSMNFGMGLPGMPTDE